MPSTLPPGHLWVGAVLTSSCLPPGILCQAPFKYRVQKPNSNWHKPRVGSAWLRAGKAVGAAQRIERKATGT